MILCSFNSFLGRCTRLKPVIGQFTAMLNNPLSTSAMYCYNRKAEYKFYRKIFPYLNHPDGSVNHMGIQQNILIITISVVTLKLIQQYYGEKPDAEEGEKVKEIEKPSSEIPSPIVLVSSAKNKSETVTVSGNT